MGTSFEYGKTLAGEGSILLILGLVPYVGWVLGIIGVILLLRGVKELANYYQDSEIYQNSLTGVKFYIIALVAAAVAIAGIVIGVGSATSFKYTHFTLNVGFGIGLAIFFGGLIIAFLFNVLAATHLRQTFNTLAQKSGEHSFSTAAALLWWGSILTILFGLGLLLIFIAWIFAVVGFFSMKPQQQQQQQNASQSYSYIQPPAQPTATQQAARYCSNCGAPVAPDATYCPHCGKKLTA